MVFSTILFLFRFLPITLALYYLAPAKLKNTVLFLCSLVFYCWGEVRFFPIMIALILLNYLCGLGLERFDGSEPARKLCAQQRQRSAGDELFPHPGHQHPAAGHQLLYVPDALLYHRRLPPGRKNGAQHH